MRPLRGRAVERMGARLEAAPPEVLRRFFKRFCGTSGGAVSCRAICPRDNAGGARGPCGREGEGERGRGAHPGHQGAKGLKIGTPMPAMSSTLRVTRGMPLAKAVAAIWASMEGRLRPVRSASPQRYFKRMPPRRIRRSARRTRADRRSGRSRVPSRHPAGGRQGAHQPGRRLFHPDRRQAGGPARRGKGGRRHHPDPQPPFG